jgi:hypothetical protein
MMWRSLTRLRGGFARLLSIFGVCFLVAFAPQSAWADTATPTPTDTATSTASASSSSPPSSEPTSTASPSSTVSGSSPSGTESDPLIVQFPVEWLAVFLLVGALIVFLLAALLVSGWGGN